MTNSYKKMIHDKTKMSAVTKKWANENIFYQCTKSTLEFIVNKNDFLSE